MFVIFTHQSECLLYSPANQNVCYIYRHQPEVEALQEEINILNEQLDESKYEQDKQRRLIQTLKDVSYLELRNTYERTLQYVFYRPLQKSAAKILGFCMVKCYRYIIIQKTDSFTALRLNLSVNDMC